MSEMSTCEPNDAAGESSPRQYPTLQLPLRLIDVGKRLRGLKAAQLIHIKESLADQGQLQAIIVTPTEDGRYALLAGNYRKAAAEKLGWETIRAEVRKGLSEDESLLIEIDENLKRNDLSPAERAKHTAERKKIYERIYPETKPTKIGGPGRGKTRRQIGDESVIRFTKHTAAETGQSERTVQRDARRGETKRIEEIEGTSLDKGVEIDAVQELQQLDPAKADELLNQAAAGEDVSAKAEVAKTKPPRKTKTATKTIEGDTFKTRTPRQDDSIAGDAALETPMAVIAMLDAIFAKAQDESFWGNASTESVKKLIVNLGAAVASAHTIKCCLNKAKANTASRNGASLVAPIDQEVPRPPGKLVGIPLSILEQLQPLTASISLI